MIGRRCAKQYAAVVAALLVGVVVTTDARAHAGLVKSDPGRRETLIIAPTEIRLWFNEAIEEKFSGVVLERDGGGVVVTGKPVVDAQDPRLLKVSVPSLVPGNYTVRYRVLSVDGHVVKHGYTFRITEKVLAPSPTKSTAKNPAP